VEGVGFVGWEFGEGEISLWGWGGCCVVRLVWGGLWDLVFCW
jgi:hypothetical protein